ncbi:MAG: hypothetical protein OXH16_13085 [Gemmatimonadetes bacterium]|nr:hypothetical protein [Gemmatimonadota bacterium]
MKKHWGVIAIFVLVIALGMIGESKRFLGDNAPVEVSQVTTGEKMLEKLLVDAYEKHAALPVFKTLYEGSDAKVKFHSYRNRIVERLREPNRLVHGDPPFNQGAKYAYWFIEINGRKHTVSLSLRGVSAHYRKQGITPIIDFSLRQGHDTF